MALKLSELKVLIVEDNREAMQLLKMVLRDLGLGQVFSAGDGAEAEAFLAAAHEMVDLIICDWRMPRMTGIELLEQVRMNYPAMPFIMVTANRDIDSVKAARGLGVNAYIVKPYAPEQLESKLTALARQL